MRVLFTSIRNTGHFQPLVPLIAACLRQGHEVGVAAPPDLAERAAKTGARFFPFGHPGDEALKPIWARLRTVPPEEAKRIVIGEIFAGADARAALPALLETAERFRPAVIVRESQEYAAILAAEKHGVPHARVAISLPRLELEVFDLVGSVLDAHRAEHGLQADPSGSWRRREAAFTQIPAGFESADSPAANLFRFRVLPKEAAPLPPWWGARQDPLLYVTLGTVTGGMDAQRGAYRVVLEAVGGLPVRALLTTGADLPPEDLGAVPPNVHVERFVPQDDVLPHAAAILCHGGSGTVVGALGAGVPLVVTPMFADQPLNAERVAATGAGLALPPEAVSPDALRRAVTRVLEEPAFRAAARRLAAEIASLPSDDDAARELERLAGAGAAA